MKRILLSPLNLLLIVGTATVLLFVVFHLLSERRRQLIGEKFFFIYYVFVMHQLTLEQFLRLHPSFIGSNEFKLSSVYSLFNIVLYPLVAIMLNVSSRHFLINTVYLFFANPLLGLITFISIISSAWSVVPVPTLKYSLAFFLFSAIAAHIARRYNWDQITGVMRWGHTMVMIWSAYYGLFKPALGVDAKGWRGVLNHPNSLAQSVSLCVVLWVVYAVANPKYRIFSSLVAFAGFIVLQRSGGVGGLVTCQVLLFQFALILFVKRFSFKVSFTIIIIYMMLAIGGGLFFGFNYEYIMVDVLNKDMTLTGRTEFWPILVEKINDRPFLGYGLNGFWLSELGLDNPALEVKMANGFVPHSSHNGFLEIGITCGWVGLLLFFASMIANAIQGIIFASRSKKPEDAFPLVYITLMILANITDSYTLDIRMHWFYYIIVSIRLSLDVSLGIRSQLSGNNQRNLKLPSNT